MMKKSLNSTSGYRVAKVKSRQVPKPTSPYSGRARAAAVSDAPKVEMSQNTMKRGEPQFSSIGRAMIQSTNIDIKNQNMLLP